MKEIIQIYTDSFKGNMVNSHKLVFIAEGYRSIDETQFYKDVYAILDRLENTFPFSVLKGNINITATFFLSLKKHQKNNLHADTHVKFYKKSIIQDRK